MALKTGKENIILHVCARCWMTYGRFKCTALHLFSDTLYVVPCQNICCLLRFECVSAAHTHTLWLWPSDSIFNCVTFRATHTAFACRQIYYVRHTCIRAHARSLHARVGTESDIGRKASNQIHLINLDSLWHHVAAEHRFFSAYACVS